MQKRAINGKKEQMEKKTNNKMIHLNPNISVITWKRKRRNTPMI